MVGASSVNGVGHRSVLVVNFAGGLRLVVLQTDDVIGPKGRRTNIGRIEEGVVGENDVVGGDGFSIGELHANAKPGGVLGGVGGFVIFNLGIGGTLVEIVGPIVVAGFTLNRVEDDAADAVSSEQGNLRHTGNVNIIGRIREERAELLGEFGVRNDERGGDRRSGGQILAKRLVFKNNSRFNGCLGSNRRISGNWNVSGYRCISRGRRSGRASGQHAGDHDANNQKRKHLTGFLHFSFPP